MDPSAPASLLESLRALPLGTHVTIGAGLLTGLLLWAVGRRALKPAFTITGVALGGFAGLLFSPLVNPPAVGPLEPPYVGLAAGAVGGLIVSLVLFRVLTAVAAGVVLAVAGVLGAAAYLDAQPKPDGPALVDVLPEAGPEGPPADPPAETQPATLEESARSLLERTRAFLDSASAGARERWKELPARSRLVLVGGGVLGFLAGLFVGLAIPKRTAGAVSALLGAAIWLPSLVWLAHAVDAPGSAYLHQPPVRWLIIWLAAASVGAVLQALAALRQRPKPAE